jgi:signal transduction histidine kinase
VLVNLAAVLLVLVWLVYPRGVQPDAFGLATGLVALAAWAAWAVVRAGRLRDVFLVSSALLGAAAAEHTDALLISVVIASIISFVAVPGRSVWSAVALTVGVGVIMGVFAVLANRDAPYLLSVYGGLALAVLVGITRQQGRLAQLREHELLARSLEVERESARAQLLAERASVARDIHDVLAHSLGGLVIQLDAVEALLEAGRTTEATERVTQAHRLAVDGLTDARRAVSALRDDTPSEVAIADSALSDLLATHRGLGFRTEQRGDLGLAGVDPAHRAVLARALQEALSNARRHAPHSSARIRSQRSDATLTVSVSTTLGGDTAATSGHGLAGMRERLTRRF